MFEFMELEIYLSAMYIISGVLAIILAIGIKNISGKNWLLVSAVALIILSLRSIIIFFIFEYAMGEGANTAVSILDWVLGIVFIVSIAAFAVFLFANWSASRINMPISKMLFSFSGRVPRSAFWIATTITSTTMIQLVLTTVRLNRTGGVIPDPIAIVLLIIEVCILLACMWVNFAIYAKRWHDLAKSGWMSLVLLVPVLGALYVTIYLGFVKGADEENQYGDNTLIKQPAP